MASVVLTIILAVYFFAVSWRIRQYCPEERTAKITKPLSIAVRFIPLIGIVIFGVLFAFVLKGRFAERCTHAFLVLAMWMYATQFYQYILSYYKQKETLIGSIIGVGFSVIMAVLLTPLDQYVRLVYSFLNWGTILLGCGLWIVFYAASILVTKKHRKES